jgi:predicted chitinase
MKTQKDVERIIHSAKQNLGIDLSLIEAKKLRIAQMAINRFDTDLCNGDIQIDEEDGTAYRVERYYDSTGKMKYRKMKTWNRTELELKKAQKIADRHGVQVYHQADPRGCSLYLVPKGHNGDNYHQYTYL